MSDLSQSLIDAAAEAAVAVLRDETGGCHCDEAYIDRGKLDPDCVYHQVGGAEFAAMAATTVVVAVLETLAAKAAPMTLGTYERQLLRRLASEVREGTDA